MDRYLEVVTALSNLGLGSQLKYHWKVQQLPVPPRIRLVSLRCPIILQSHTNVAKSLHSVAVSLFVAGKCSLIQAILTTEQNVL